MQATYHDKYLTGRKYKQFIINKYWTKMKAIIKKTHLKEMQAFYNHLYN